MPEISRATRIQRLARKGVMASLERAKRDYAHIPLNVEKLDPRTEKKRTEANKLPPGIDTTLSRLEYEMKQGEQQ